jgi:Xaa-Pro aminopeptidase
VSERTELLLARLADAGVEAMLVTGLVNVRYLTGFTGSNALVLISPERRTFITDFRYVEQAAAEVDPSFDRLLARAELIDLLDEVVPDSGARLGFEDAHVSVRQHGELAERLGSRAELVATSGLVEGLRAVKDAHEIASIKAAAALADSAFEELIGGGLAGRTEREAAIALEQRMRELGAERPSFDAIVASGAHGALPHATPRDVEIRPGDLVVIDWGAQLDGYCSDCTRTVAAGEPAAGARDVYQLVLDAQLAGVAAVRAAASGREVDALARKVIEEGGRGEQFGHGLGHGVGLEVHEAPRLSKRSEDDLRPGNVVTVEPGVYVPGSFGVRIEDLVVVREGGCEVLSSVPKELTVL